MNAPALKFEPRAWQKKALRAWELAEKRGIAKVVTGGGKTVFAELCMTRILETEHQPRFVILVPTLSLLDQWTLSLEDEFSVNPADIALWSGGKKPREPKTFNVAVINSARTLIGKMTGGNHPTMLIVDEVHRAASEQNAKALEGEFVATLGLSATPERQFDDLFEEVLQPRIGPIIFDYDIIAAAKDGILSRFETVNVEFELLADEADAYNDLTARIARRRAMVSGDDDETRADQPLSRSRPRLTNCVRKMESKEFVDSITIDDAPPPEIVAAANAQLVAQAAEHEPNLMLRIGGNVCKIFISDDYSVNDPYYVHEITKESTVVVVNQNHPHWIELQGSEGVLNYLRHCVYDAIAEWQASLRTSAILPETVRTYKDKLLRLPAQIEDTSYYENIAAQD